MTFRVAVECFADSSLLRFLREDCGLPVLKEVHAESQGRVVKAVLEKGQAELGIVDEDPGKPHHALRDQARVVRERIDIQVLIHNRRELLVIKPDLEVCFFRAMSRAKETSWFGSSSRMHRVLGVSASREHDRFRAELRSLRSASIRLGVPTFVTELEDELKRVTGT